MGVPDTMEDLMRLRSLLPQTRSVPERLTGFRGEMDRLFDDFFRGIDVPGFGEASGFLSPAIDVAETERGLEVTAELPGIDKKDIEVDIHDGLLTIKAERQQETEKTDDKKAYRLTERSYGTFLRRFSLPFEVDDTKVEATFTDGVLKLDIPRAPESERKAKRISID